jgi:hypothetical protein
MPPVEPTALIAVTLQAQEWNQVMALLSDAPYRIVAGIIGKVGEQLTAAASGAEIGRDA